MDKWPPLTVFPFCFFLTFLGSAGVFYSTSKEKRLSSSVTSLTQFTSRPCRPSCSFTWEPSPTPSPLVACLVTLRKTCRSDPVVGSVLPDCPPHAVHHHSGSFNVSLCLGLQGVLESFLGTAIAGGVFCLLAGQPLTILSSTGPVLVFERLLFNFSR